MNSLTQNWLAIELSSVNDEFEGWSEGVKASYNSLFSADNDDMTNARSEAEDRFKEVPLQA